MAEANLYAAVGGYFGRPNEPGLTGVFRRPAGDRAWQHVLGHEAFTVAVHPADSSVVLAGTSDGVWRSTDAGETFTRTDFPDPVQIWSIAPAPADPRVLFAGGSPVAVYRSEDAGEHWTRLPAPALPDRAKMPFACRVMRFAPHPRNPGEVFAALEVNGVMRSSDGGESWHDCSADLVRWAEREPRLRSKIVSDTEHEGMLDAHAIAASPADPDGVVLAVRMGLFRSADRGAHWQDMQVGRFSPFTYARDIRVAPSDPNTLYACLSVAAASTDGALFRSDDLGNTWARFDKVQPHGTLMSVALHRNDAKQVYVAARYGEVFGTRDGGESWAPMPLPLGVKDVYALACG
ncbi:MAG: hypothetical protein JO047_14040 [Alphaproteobacteria bacterium]|nr:hypothetical protein [Alphaproteobacteria bacterium]